MHFLITAGGTREHIDPVRYIGNKSSGKMGYAIARAAVQRSHNVTLITTVESLHAPEGAQQVRVESAAEMFGAVKKHFESADCLIMAAAVSDFTPAERRAKKIKKSGKGFTLELKPTSDILKWAGQNKTAQQRIVGFALEDTDARENAEKKMDKKNLDMAVLNRPETLAAETAKVEIKSRTGQWRKFQRDSKSVVAGEIISAAESLFTERAI
jgi:phosphopantothenoylcysteine decarboxylase/phosphopantothenate--cysteine ligase